jgi:hypothetical protein
MAYGRLTLHLIGHLLKLAKHQAIAALFVGPRVIGHATPLASALGRPSTLLLRWTNNTPCFFVGQDVRSILAQGRT